MATMVPPQKNVEYIFFVGLVSQADTKLLQNNPTLAAGDVLVSTDGGATANLTTLPVVTPASSDMVKVTVSTTEMNGDNVIIVFSDATGSEWCDLLINIQTSAQSLDTMDTNIDDIETDTNELQGLIASSKIAAQVKGIDDIDLSATMKTSVNAEVDTALNTAIPASPVAHSVNERVKAVDDKLPSSTYLKGSADADGGMDTNDKADVNAQADTALTDYDPSTKTEMDTAHALLATPAQVNAQCDTALTDYDAPTKTEMDTAHALLATPAQVNTQVKDVLETDTHAEPSAVVAATASLKDKIGWVCAFLRNKMTQTADTQTLRNDADDADIASSTVSDDGTTFTRGEFS